MSKRSKTSKGASIPAVTLVDLIAFVRPVAVAASVIPGPVHDNGHAYLLLDQKGWIASEAEVVSLGLRTSQRRRWAIRPARGR